jgi:endonuclease/exonuclease/phosphatase family metal-dependent hydrolase
MSYLSLILFFSLATETNFCAHRATGQDWDTLLVAIQNGDLSAVQRIVPSKIAADATTRGGRSLIQIATYHNQPAVVSYLKGGPAPVLLDKNKALLEYEKKVKTASAANAKIPQRADAIFRVMTYNVHFWQSPDKKRNVLSDMIAVIKKVDPDIVVLQEVSPKPGFGNGNFFENSEAMQALKDIGFKEFSACNTLPDAWFGNVIASKKELLARHRYAFTKQVAGRESRCYVGTNIMLPNKKELYIYGTHLEVQGDDSVREGQMKEIVDQYTRVRSQANTLIAADFNATRTSSVITFLQNKGFIDAFNYMGWQQPALTNWTGKEIDFIFLSPDWNLPLAGCYVYYDATSDHLPIILDIKLESVEQKSQEARQAEIDAKLQEEADLAAALAASLEAQQRAQVTSRTGATTTIAQDLALLEANLRALVAKI